MHRFRRSLGWLALCLSAVVVPPVWADDVDDAWAAQQAALDWLALTDAGQYAESWDSAAPELKARVDVAAWEMSLRWTRSPLASVIQRDIESSNVVHGMPGQPEGRYVVLRYSTVYQYKVAGLETLTCIRGVDGVWRVGGYVIQ